MIRIKKKPYKKLNNFQVELIVLRNFISKRSITLTKVHKIKVSRLDMYANFQVEMDGFSLENFFNKNHHKMNDLKTFMSSIEEKDSLYLP